MARRERRAKAVLAADLHVRADTPACRTDDFLAAQERKLKFISDLCITHNATLFIAGDIGHRAQWPNWLLRDFILIMRGVDIIAIPGQHDLPSHSLQNIPRSAIGVLDASKDIYIHNDSYVFPYMKAMDLTCVPYGTDIPKTGWRDNVPQMMMMIHSMIVEDTPLWPGQEAPKAHTFLRKHKRYNLILSGDNHKAFVAEYEGRVLVNPGSMMRTSADQVDHRPRVYLWYHSDNRTEVEPVYLPIEEGVVSREHVDVVQQRDERMEAFVSRLNTDVEVGLSFEKNLEEFIKRNRVRRPVERLVWEALEGK